MSINKEWISAHNHPNYCKCPDCGKEFVSLIKRVFHMKKEHGTSYD